MGTMISIHVHDAEPDDVLQAAIDEVFAEIERLEQIFSTFRADSSISRINRGELHLLDAEPEVAEVLDACTWLEHVSDGAFNAHLPGHPDQLDPAGYVKGWITERAAGRLDDAGLAHWYVGAGGDVITRGVPAPGQRWRVGIAHPLQPGAIVATLELAGGAVATSGTAERGRHLWDGRTGASAEALASLTVVGPELTWADAFATAAFAQGADGLQWVTRFDGYSAMAVDLDGQVRATDGFLRPDR
jgi:thiamine biosynthesis lipoprotein